MLYIILDKKTRQVLNDYQSDDSNLKPQDAYSSFNPETMQLLRTELSIQAISDCYDAIDGHFHIEENGLLKEKTLAEKAASNALPFDPELLEQSEELDKIEGATPSLKIVSLALQLKLLQTIEDCEQAFQLLDEEMAQCISEKYTPAMELKIMKEYMDWLEAGKPSDDPRQAKYQKMQTFINALKTDYKDIRTQLKATIIPLIKEENLQEGEDPNNTTNVTSSIDPSDFGLTL